MMVMILILLLFKPTCSENKKPDSGGKLVEVDEENGKGQRKRQNIIK